MLIVGHLVISQVVLHSEIVGQRHFLTFRCEKSTWSPKRCLPSYCSAASPFGQMRPTFREKEAWADRTRAPSVAAHCIGLQGLLCRWVDRHIPRFAELGAADRQYTVRQIDVTAVEAQRFVATHAGRHVQTEEGGKGLWPQTASGGQSFGRLDQCGDFAVAVDIR